MTTFVITVYTKNAGIRHDNKTFFYWNSYKGTQVPTNHMRRHDEYVHKL